VTCLGRRWSRDQSADGPPKKVSGSQTPYQRNLSYVGYRTRTAASRFGESAV
jgi:hypothetical protein